MSDHWVDQLRAEPVDTDPRPGFKKELRRDLGAEWDGNTEPASPAHRSRRRWGLLAAAASVGVLVVGLVVVTGSDDAVAPATVPVTAAHVPATTTDTSTSRPDVSASAVATSAPASSTPSSSTPTADTVPTALPASLEDWPRPADVPGSVDDVPALLPSEPVPGAARIIRSGTAGGGLAFDNYVQSFYDTDRDVRLVVGTILDPAPITAEEFREDPVDTSEWDNHWLDAYFVRSPDEQTTLELIAPGGLVRINALGLAPDEVVDIARTMQRRPSPQPGWDLHLPAALRRFAESEAGPEAGRSLDWIGSDGSPIAGLRVETEDAEALVAAWPDDADADIIDLDGTTAVVAVAGNRVSITWSRPDGIEVMLIFLGTRAGAEHIARSIETVDPATWLAATEPPDPTHDGCNSLFC